MTETIPEPGLRERKRLATRRAILLAAIQVVRDRGLEGATVDEISRIADVSPRTFFNYFPSKEDAILGDGPQLADGEVIDDFVADRGPIFEGLVRVFTASISPVHADQELVRLRRDLGKLHPEISLRRMASLRLFEAEVADLVRLRLVAEHPDLIADERRLDERARLVALMAIAALRHAWLCWSERGEADGPLTDRLRDTFTQMVEVVDSAGA